MAKSKSTHIALEIEAFEKKIKEFQRYLASKDINNIFDDAARAKEIDIQIKLNTAIPNMLEQLNRLRIEEESILETRGGGEITGVMDEFLNKNK
jgi:hypothetical protein